MRNGDKYPLDEWMKKLAFGRANESRPTFEWKHWAPVSPWKQLTGTQESLLCGYAVGKCHSFHQTHHLIKGLLYSSSLSACPLNAWGFKTSLSKEKMRHGWGRIANQVKISAHLISCIDDTGVIEYTSAYKLAYCTQQHVGQPWWLVWFMKCELYSFSLHT